MMITSLPYIIRGLGIIGVIAMILVGGGMFTHNIPYLHHFAAFLPSILADFIVGIVVGLILLVAHHIVMKLVGKDAHESQHNV